MPATQKSTAPACLESTVQPHEANNLPLVEPTPAFDDGVRAMAVACNGFVYLGSDIEAQLRAIRFLRTRPDVAQALGIGQV